MKIFYEGLNIEKYSQYDFVEGFTTNCTLFSCSETDNYTDFYQKNRPFLQDRSFSLQTWEYGNLGIEQIDAIHAIDETIFIDIPIVDPNNDINERPLKYAVSKNMRINVTAVYTYEQINIAYAYLSDLKNDAIVSIFAGGISDWGADPSSFILHAKRLFRGMNNVKILWAGCRELYAIKRAEEVDCDIVAVPGDIIDTLHLFDSDLDKMSVDRVRGLRDDAIHGGLSI
jgi:transaldolase